jgi:hypothetical protein
MLRAVAVAQKPGALRRGRMLLCGPVWSPVWIAPLTPKGPLQAPTVAIW